MTCPASRFVSEFANAHGVKITYHPPGHNHTGNDYPRPVYAVNWSCCKHNSSSSEGRHGYEHHEPRSDEAQQLPRGKRGAQTRDGDRHKVGSSLKWGLLTQHLHELPEVVQPDAECGPPGGDTTEDKSRLPR